MELASFYADPEIIEAIYNLRLGKPFDAWKLWARDFFREFLPRELAEYHYVADFNGLSMSGLEAAKPMVTRLFEEAYDLLRHPIFSPKSTQEMRETNVFKFDYKPVSYTHLDVYKRQHHELIKALHPMEEAENPIE